MSIKRFALRYAEYGYRVLRLPKNQKWPPPVGWQRTATSDLALARRMFVTDGNVAIDTSNVTVVDIDVKAELSAFVERHRDAVTTVIETARGAHVYFRDYGSGSRKLPFGDLKARGGYVVGAGSVVAGWTYRFMDDHDLVPIDQLKPIPKECLPKRREGNPIQLGEPDHILRTVLARAWVAKADPAISGQRGHDQMFYVACWLFRRFGLSREEAWPLLLEFNDRCMPPFSTKELEHKLNDAAKKGAARC